MRRGEWDGLNVTIPHKEAVIPYLDELDEAARRAGAVNTIYRKDGRLIGTNTMEQVSSRHSTRTPIGRDMC